MKKIIISLCASLMLFGMVGCTNQADQDTELITEAISTMFTTTGESINEYYEWLGSEEVMVELSNPNIATGDSDIITAKNEETFGEFFTDEGLQKAMMNRYVPDAMMLVMNGEMFVSSQLVLTKVVSMGQEGQFTYKAEITVIDENNETVTKNVEGEVGLDNETHKINAITIYSQN